MGDGHETPLQDDSDEERVMLEESGRTSAKHTPGPWAWWTSNSWRRLKRDDRGITQNVIEPFVASDGHPDLTVSDADMALIAAAPDLLAALKSLMASCSCRGCESQHPRIGATYLAQAAIAKAEPQS